MVQAPIKNMAHSQWNHVRERVMFYLARCHPAMISSNMQVSQMASQSASLHSRSLIRWDAPHETTMPLVRQAASTVTAGIGMQAAFTIDQY